MNTPNPNSPIVLIRPEQPALIPAIQQVEQAAFGREDEAQLVETLRDTPEFNPKLSLMALYDGQVVGHVLFSPMQLDGAAHLTLFGLGPLAVLPDYQKQGIGSALCYEGIEICRKLRADAVFVLGDPAYYRRFGFRPTTGTGIHNKFDPSGKAFQMLLLNPIALDDMGGEVNYHRAFDAV